MASRLRSSAVDAVEQRLGFDSALMVWAEGSQAGIVSGCGQDAGFGIAAQPRQGGGKGQFDSASIWMALALRQTAVQLVGTLRLGQGLFVAGLAVEAACQTEPQDQGQPVGCAMGGQGLAASASASGWRP
ncbi:hypothetical protein [Streptomyces sp. NPDC056634]|uniref:hypothetical protein n=1 Tax=Streptomyces sp. NPDC056634 TaxID=3345885 RepID=UPI003677F62B